MIDKMHKVIFYGVSDSIDAFMKRAQRIGSCQFFSLKPSSEHRLSKEVERTTDAIKLLNKQPLLKQEHISQHDCEHFINKILHHHYQIQTYNEELKKLKSERLKVSPFGRFSLEEVKQIEKESGKYFQFFMIRHTKVSGVADITKNLFLISREKEFDYFLSVCDQRVSYRDFYEVHIEQTKGEIELRINECRDLIKKEQAQLKEAAKYLDVLKAYLIEQLNKLHLQLALSDVDLFLGDDLFAIDAWVPDSKLSSLKEIASSFQVSFSFVKIEKGDKPPTYIKNKGFSKTGQDLVAIYDTPSLEDRDPSIWVVVFFCIFFAIIVSDAGYGLIFFLASLFLMHKFKEKVSAAGLRAIKLFRILSISSIIWGVLVGSYFSIHIKPDSKFNHFNILKVLAIKKVQYHINEKDEQYKEWISQYPALIDVVIADDFINKGVKQKGEVKEYQILDDMYNTILLEIAVLVGIIHLSFSFARNLFRDYSGIGWLCVLWGGFLAFSTVVDAVTVFSYVGSMSLSLVKAMGFDFLYGGLIVAFVLSIVQEGIVGLGAIFKIVEVFSDVLSYLRLYALGLASMVLAATFNEIASMTGSYFFGALICLFGHSINMALAVMAGVIHGLRLNFLEWYRHSYQGGGVKFNPLRILTTS